METLETLRKKIDTVDNGILKLLNKRTQLVLEIFKLKKEHKIQQYVPEREQEIFKRLCTLNKGPFPNSALSAVYREIISALRSITQPLRIAYLGPEGTFTHQAALAHFGSLSTYIPMKTIADVFNSLIQEKTDLGIVPIENSIEGTVTHTLDMLVEVNNLSIQAELFMEISQNLLSKQKDKSKIRRIYSHPQAFAQCRKYLLSNFPDVEYIEVSSTGHAAARAVEDLSSAAIGSELAAKIYKLNCLERCIDERPNYTRFFVIGPVVAQQPTGDDKTSLLIWLKDKVGALHEMLGPFVRHKINLTKIESRPSRQQPWEYVFFIDIQGHKEDMPVKKAIEELQQLAVHVKILGSYSRSKFP